MTSGVTEREFLICYCGAEVACYHTECLAIITPEDRKRHDRFYNGR